MKQATAFTSSSFFGNTDSRWATKTNCISPTHRPDFKIATLNMQQERNASDLQLSKVLNVQPSRRALLQIAAFMTLPKFNAPALADESDIENGYSTYKGPISLGYSFSYPSEWIVKKKPIKTHLSEIIVTDNLESSSSAGLVVDAVKINSIDKFGSPDAVGEKVVAVESKKESVKEAVVTSTKSIQKGGLVYYIIDYTVDSTRGLKRYIAKATVSGGQLYVLTTQAKVDNYSGQTEEKFKEMLNSFNVIKQYL